MNRTPSILDMQEHDAERLLLSRMGDGAISKISKCEETKSSEQSEFVQRLLPNILYSGRHRLMDHNVCDLRKREHKRSRQDKNPENTLVVEIQIAHGIEAINGNNSNALPP